MKNLATKQEFSQILSLQRENNVSSVGITDRGFLKFLFKDEQHMEVMVQDLGFIVVRDGSEVVAYSMLITPEEAARDSFENSLVEAYSNLGHSLKGVAVVAQICIRDDHRGGKALRELLRLQKEFLLSKGFNKSVGEIDYRNRSSFLAMQRMGGYKVVGEYDCWKVMERTED